MEAVVMNYRGSKRTRYRYGHHLILKVTSINTKKDAQKLLNKKVTWKTPSGKLLTGTIVKEHGNSGAVRAVFTVGLPGQALGGKVTVN